MGALLSAALHKGYGLALMCELLGAVATGGNTIAPHHHRPPAVLNSMLTVIFDPVRTSGGAPLEALYREAELLVEHVKSAPHRAAEDAENEGILIPGEKARRKRLERSERLELNQGTWESLLLSARSLGIHESEFVE